MAAIARNASGGLLAYVVDGNHDGMRELIVQALDGAGAVRGSSVTLRTGAHPSHPALVARGDGYVIAWREGSPGSEKVVVRGIDAAGALASGDALVETPTGWYGAPAITVVGDAVHVAYAHGERPADAQSRAFNTLAWRVAGSSGAPREISAPQGAHFDAEFAPEFARGSNPRARLFTLVRDDDHQHGDERALVELSSEGDTLRLVARDVDAPSALGSADGSLLVSWRGHVGARDVGPRVSAYAPDGALRSPPVTAGVFRGAINAEARLTSLGENLVGVFTVSTLADDAGGTLNASLFTSSGAYVGRQPLLLSSLVRNARVVSASRDDNAWFAIEGRGDNGAVALGVVSVRCDTARPANRLEVPPPSLVQRLSDVDEPVAGTPAQCANMATPLRVTADPAQQGNIVAGRSVHAVALRSGWKLFHANGETITLHEIDASGRLTTQGPPMAAPYTGILAAGSVGGTRAFAIARGRTGDAAVFTTGPRGFVASSAASGITNATSASVVRGASSFVLTGSGPGDATGERSLWSITWAGSRTSAPVRLAHLHPGDRVLDAAHVGAETLVLLARPDGYGETVGHELAVARVPDRVAPAQLEARVGDPFADPLGHGRGPASLVVGAAARGTTPVYVAYAERETVRFASLRGSELHEPRSLSRSFPGGGTHLAFGDGDGAWRWAVLSSGLPESDQTARGSGITLLGFEALGTGLALGARTITAPEDPNAIAEGAQVAARGREALLVYPRVEQDGTLSWMAARAQCAVARGGAR